eukprot:2820309-Rhodomonas_salina.2
MAVLVTDGARGASRCTSSPSWCSSSSARSPTGPPLPPSLCQQRSSVGAPGHPRQEGRRTEGVYGLAWGREESEIEREWAGGSECVCVARHGWAGHSKTVWVWVRVWVRVYVCFWLSGRGEGAGRRCRRRAWSVRSNPTSTSPRSHTPFICPRLLPVCTPFSPRGQWLPMGQGWVAVAETRGVGWGCASCGVHRVGGCVADSCVSQSVASSRCGCARAPLALPVH